MRNLEKYKGVIPAFYACYDKEGNVSPEGVQESAFIRASRIVRSFWKML